MLLYFVIHATLLQTWYCQKLSIFLVYLINLKSWWWKTNDIFKSDWTPFTWRKWVRRLDWQCLHLINVVLQLYCVIIYWYLCWKYFFLIFLPSYTPSFFSPPLPSLPPLIPLWLLLSHQAKWGFGVHCSVKCNVFAVCTIHFTILKMHC